MPHVIIEYAAPLGNDIDIQQLVEDAFAGADESGLFSTAAIKARATPVNDYWIGGAKQPFIHVEVKILPGRTAAQKKDLSERIFAKVAARAQDTVAISVEINDLDGDSYTKRA